MTARAQEPPAGVQATALDQLMTRLRKRLASALSTGEGVRMVLDVGPRPSRGGARDVRIEIVSIDRVKIIDAV